MLLFLLYLLHAVDYAVSNVLHSLESLQLLVSRLWLTLCCIKNCCWCFCYVADILLLLIFPLFLVLVYLLMLGSLLWLASLLNIHVVWYSAVIGVLLLLASFLFLVFPHRVSAVLYRILPLLNVDIMWGLRILYITWFTWRIDIRSTSLCPSM